MTMECLHCKGTLKPGRTCYVINRNGYHLIIDEVPALICQQCGEALFTEEAIELIQRMIRSIDTQRAALSTLSVAA